MAHPVYHLELSALRCRAEFRLNDVPIAELVATAPRDWTAPPINPFLVKDLNVLDVTVHSEAGSTIDDASIEGILRPYEIGDVVAEGEGPEALRFTIPDDLIERMKEEELELPQSFSVVFDNDVVDFRRELNEAPALADTERLLDYAIHLRDLARAGDRGGLLEEFRAKAAVWSHAYDTPEPAFVSSLQEEIGVFLSGELDLDFGRGDVELVSGAGGRIWKLRRDHETPLLRSTLEDGAIYQFHVWVGERDGALRIVR